MNISRLKSGFTIIELIIVIILLGVMAMVVVPRFSARDSKNLRQDFLAQLNQLVSTVQYQAILSGKVNRLVFDLKQRAVYMEESVDQLDSLGQKQFEKLKIDYNQNSLPLEQSFVIEQFYINGKNVLDTDEQNSAKAWIYFMPDGTTQSVVINWLELGQSEKKQALFSFVLNPFFAQFKLG